MDSLLERRFEEAKKGRLYWIYLQEKYKLSALDYVLLIPEDGDIIHLTKRFRQYITRRNGGKGKGVIVANKELICKISITEKEALYAETCSSMKAENLMRFYCMYQFTSNLLIASLTKPDGRRGINIAGKNGFSMEEILDMVVFKIEKE